VPPFPRTWAEIDLSAVTHNLAEIQRVVGPSVSLALVAKADGYGHGLVPISRHALRHGCKWIAVATVQEAISLRDAAVDTPIMAMSPLLPVEADQAVFYDVDVFVENAEMIEALDRAGAGTGRKARVHLKVDTGMHRFGCMPEEALDLARLIASRQHLEFVGLAQHFADATGETDSPVHQMKRFWPVVAEMRAAGLLPPEVHLAASGGSMNFPESRGTLIRTGIGAYGVDPKNYLRGNARPSLSWYARVTALRTVPAGEQVGYGGTFTTTRPTRIATLGVGYGDGYGRAFSNKSWVMLQGRRAPVIGLVCMDQTMVDVTDFSEVALGDVATLIGEGVRAEQLADLIGTNPHEVLCRIMTRVPRRYLNRD